MKLPGMVYPQSETFLSSFAQVQFDLWLHAEAWIDVEEMVYC